MKRHISDTAASFMDGLLGQGRYTFSRKEALQRLKSSPRAAYMALHRLGKAGRLAMPRSGFYVIVDPQHRPAGILPPEWFVHDLMADVGKPYYVGLLSAAQFHGAAHHRPQEFQVVIPSRAIRPIRSGNVRFGFHGKGPFEKSQIQDVKTPTGLMKVSSPETTAWDLVRYPRAAGGLDNAATVLKELAGSLDLKRLRETARRHAEVVVAQRLGYLLERIGEKRLSTGLAVMVRGAPMRLLDPSRPAKGARENGRWHVLVNARAGVES
jgi:predicted transcriptional regulator of viral defense system